MEIIRLGMKSISNMIHTFFVLVIKVLRKHILGCVVSKAGTVARLSMSCEKETTRLEQKKSNKAVRLSPALRNTLAIKNIRGIMTTQAKTT